MKSIQILKGLLLWITVISVLCFMAGGFESLIETNEWFVANFWIIVNIALIYICHYNISYKELYKLSGSELINKLLRL